MAILLTLDDFKTGFHFLARSIDVDPIIQDYIDRYEESFIKRILGVDLGQKFIDDINGDDSDSSDMEERFQDLLDPFMEQDRDQRIYESNGFKDILASLVYYQYVADTASKHTLSGVALAQAETAGVFTPENQIEFAERKYNDATRHINAIQWLCVCKSPKVYPEFMGQKFKVISAKFL